jgi:20S proteasome subunit beta 3
MSDPFSINGGSIVALAGKDCVGIACDLRLGQQAMTISTDFPKIFPMGDKVFLGLSGLATDVQTLYSPSSTLTHYRNERFRFKVNMYKLREERPIEPKTLAHLVSSTLYEKRFGPYFISPIVAGLNSKTNEPYICGFDNIGYHS